MARIFVTGSTDGLGKAAARAAMDAGHAVVLHARNQARLRAVADLADRAAGVVVGDLSNQDETEDLAEQVNEIGRMDAVIHNAGVLDEPGDPMSGAGYPRILMVNAVAPYLLTCRMARPHRVIYLSSDMHHRGDPSLADLDWDRRTWNASQAYSDSKLFVTALALAIARRWPDVCSNAVDPGWVPTKMGGPGAPDDLWAGHLTQVWLAVSDDPDATTSGGYWYHQRRRIAAPAARDEGFQERLLEVFAGLSRVTLD
ncbi:MAG: SDR family NAD(P)-dependent oxidoreductase [Acidobacteria bacterium]|jgi:NAD(P)-dependent dehydrogenase (short-subunit alcohol dehydrogenase family)|nr:SDR family NAD(P)-dependent oxidoreductase [Acidobacteriota bacterium]